MLRYLSETASGIFHVCYPIACVKEWPQYRNVWRLSIVQCKLNANQCGMHTHAHHCRAFHRILSAIYRSSYSTLVYGDEIDPI